MFSPEVSALTFAVNSDGDGEDDNPGDGNCKAAGFLFSCTLRAAIAEANALALNNLASDFEITFTPNLSPIVLTADLPLVRVPNLAIYGAAATATIVDGNNSFRGFRSYKIGGAIDENVVSLTLRDLTIRNCKTTSEGAAVAWYNYDLTIEGVRFVSNSANFGGAVSYTPRTDTPERSGKLLISDSLFFGNSANVAAMSGGGGLVASQGQVTILNTTFHANAANGNGGAMILANITGTLIGLTVTNNEHLTTEYGDGGGGIYFSTTVEGLGSVIGNSVIASNSDYGTYEANDCYTYGGPITSLGNNVIGDGTSCLGFNEPTDVVGTAGLPIDPKLGALAFHGGFTETQVPAATSPLIDAGDNLTCSNHDQRGVPRPQDGDLVNDVACDIGAVEYSHCDNGGWDADERATDCGGSICKPCACAAPENRILRVPSGSEIGYFYSDFSTAIYYAGDGDTLKVREEIFLGDVIFSKATPTTLTIQGGYDCNIAGNSVYYTKIKGALIITAHTSLVLENVTLL